MVVVTLIGEDFAEVGKTFVFRGPITECRDCKLKGICFNLDAGCRYCVKEVRDVHHECRIHESGVCAAEVEKLNINGAVPKNMHWREPHYHLIQLIATRLDVKIIDCVIQQVSLKVCASK